LAVAPPLLAALPRRGWVVTGDALSCQRDLCRRIVAADGHYLFIVQAKQPDVLWDGGVATAATWDKHGDRIEPRRRWTSAALADYLDWPGLLQVGLVERVGVRGGVRSPSSGVHYQPRSRGSGDDAAGSCG
jgi:hypothetical protein